MVRRSVAVGLVVACVLGVGGGARPAGVLADPSSRMTVVASGLNNPRGLAFGPHNVLYVAEAGLGAGDASGVKPGLGLTSSITAIRRPGSSQPTQSRTVTGLPSAAISEGGDLETIGADGIAALGIDDEVTLKTIIGAAGIPGTNYGHLLQVRDGTVTSLADVGAADLAWTSAHQNDPFAPPGGQFPDSNPYGVLVTGGHTYVADAGSNTLDEVMADGSVKILAYFPNPSVSDATPTCVTQGPDGALYVGTLALLAFFVRGPGQATVYRVDPSTIDPNSLTSVLNAPKVWATGLNTITGCAFGPEGDFYATEMFANDVVQVPFAHPATGRTIIGAGQLQLPNGVAVGPNGDVYVSNHSSSTLAGAGEVVRFRTGESDD